MMDIDEQAVVKNLMQTTREELQELVVKRVELEKQVDEHYANIEQVQQNIAKKLEEIHHFRDQESSLESKMLLLQKEAFLDKIQPQKLKKIITESQMFKNVVQKGKDIKQALDGSIMDEDWVDERYEAYRKLSIQNGTELKTKEEFKSFAMNVQKEEDAESLPLPDLFAFARRKITKAGTIVKDFLNPILEEKEIQPTKVDEVVQNENKEESKSFKKAKVVDLRSDELKDSKENSQEEKSVADIVLEQPKPSEPVVIADVQMTGVVKDIEVPALNTIVKKVVAPKQEVENASEEVTLPIQTKEELFKKWLKDKKVSKKVLSSTPPKELYELYVAYLTKKNVDVTDKTLAYQYIGGSFGKAVKSQYSE